MRFEARERFFYASNFHLKPTAKLLKLGVDY